MSSHNSIPEDQQLSPHSIATDSNNKTTKYLLIEELLTQINCNEYLNKFIEFGIIDKEQFGLLDKDILKVMGIKPIGDRIRILTKSKELSADTTISDKIREITKKINALNIAESLSVTEELVTDKHTVIFILNDGSAKKVNVNGCFNADSIKWKLIKRLSPPPEGSRKNSDAYDVFVVDYNKNVLHLLYDVELVTICHSSDRVEKNRLIFVSKDQTPSDEAIATSKKIFFKTLSVFHHHSARDNDNTIMKIENKNQQFRKIFNQRPPSELISTNLKEYFPHTDVKNLRKTVRNSIFQSARISTYNTPMAKSFENNIGGVILNNSNAVDKALLEDHRDPTSAIAGNSNDLTSLDGRQSICPSLTGAFDDDDDNASVISLPNKMATPKSWLKGARIGSGSFGTVCIGMNAETGELMAVKQVEIPKVMLQIGEVSNDESGGSETVNDDNAENKPADKTKTAKSSFSNKMVEALQHEMNLLKDLHHENIVSYYGSSEENNTLNIFLEYVPGGSVSSMLNSYGPFEPPLIKNFTRQILIGISYLHRKNIIHRDIKGANILIDIKGCVKITDFGISKKLSPLNKDSKANKRASLQGSVYWMAPEVVKQIATTSKADIWSVGCVVIEMFTGKHPFPDFSQMQAIFKIGTNTIPQIPSWADAEAEQFLMQTFKLDYKKRPNSIQLLSHPWLSTNNI
ncbi:related to Serine/threonine-protein kinase STE11 [Saccharomycodes ludwigii]|uniref:mitogen-activated protein kinase kinase kinase n=1 Tax=Saccharomycodes ludwigii TaxID=36035 RepID=A0A376B505_9ASCO|nr:hypothetical protein SCDLUD_000815 [Saccharomycodes ludwigii]KAH3903197.1 hypothetical protein SCDLUD_000815 [Saccharomycodes ludwigii]SSD59210.1 related to Serine/threonine-protein kinase STE11 [Saccharomycodes ludwigii]